MKKLLFLLAIFCTLETNAQPYSISFAGVGLSSVKIENLTSGLIVNLNAGDVLRLSAGTGIPEVNNMKSSVIKVYPNPMTDKSTLEILPPVAGDAIITICDMTGKVLTQFKDYVENYTQEFSLSGLKKGLHIINVQGDGYQFSEKLLCNVKSDGKPIIARVNNNIQAVSEKQSIKDSKGFQATIDMAYIAGERLKYTAVAGNNKTVMTDIPTADKTVTFTFTECKDGENNYYPVVQINNQFWMAENLKTTMYRNGVSIGTTNPYNKDLSGESAPTYQWAYAGNESNVPTYGRLYTWYAVTDSRNVCPTNWHVPNGDEWTTLTTYLGGVNIAGSKLKETGTTHWTTPNTDATNATGFTALPGGLRSYNGAYDFVGNNGFWWSSTEYSSTNALERDLDYRFTGFFWNYNLKPYGFSVRCVRDF